MSKLHGSETDFSTYTFVKKILLNALIVSPSFPYAMILLSHPAATIDEPQHRAYGGDGCLHN